MTSKQRRNTLVCKCNADGKGLKNFFTSWLSGRVKFTSHNNGFLHTKMIDVDHTGTNKQRNTQQEVVCSGKIISK